MKCSDVVTQLAVLLPQLTDKFTNDVPVSTILRSGTVMTAQCNSDHGMVESDAVSIVNSEMHLAISSLTRSGTVGTLVTTLDHDLTNAIAKAITISGAVEAEFNGTFTRTNIVNRKTITFEMANTGATVATGSPILHDAESALRNYNGMYKVTNVPTPSSFTFEHSVTGLANPTGSNILARTKPRISGSIDIERAIQSYTQHQAGKYWLFVILGNVEASKSRFVTSDAVDNLNRGNEYRQQLTQSASIFAFIPVNTEIAARSARDEAEDLFRPLCRSLLLSKFDSGLYSATLGALNFAGHGVHSYNTSLYIHSYDFQQVADITWDDTVGPDLDVAFRNIDFTVDPDIGTTDITGNVDLDDTSL